MALLARNAAVVIPHSGEPAQMVPSRSAMFAACFMRSRRNVQVEFQYLPAIDPVLVLYVMSTG